MFSDEYFYFYDHLEESIETERKDVLWLETINVIVL
jgi:hypothetical protein